MKIPTLLGVALIITLIGLGGIYYHLTTKVDQDINLEISDLKVVNVTDTSATIVWQSSLPSVSQVIYSEGMDLSQSAADVRDHSAPKPRLIHFVTLNNLKANTNYNYKIKSDSFLYPDKTLEFKTASFKPVSDDLTFSFLKPIKGTVLNTNLNPIDESLIFLSIPGAQELATFSSTSGNFVLPLKQVLNENFDKIFIIENNTPVELVVKKLNLKSNVKTSISEETVNLPPITIGSSLDLTEFKPQSIQTITFNEREFQGLDFNNDGAINSLDLAQLKDAVNLPGAEKPQSQSKFDINFDGKINAEDVEAFSKALSGN